MPKLDKRLIAVTKLIRSSVHVDIGSDHGGLLVSMLSSGRITYGIAIENKRQPFENSKAALRNLAAEVRFGDGLAVLKPDEAESMSICGMGAENMLAILSAFPDRVPRRLILQPNRQPEIIREWALAGGFHLVDEVIARGHWPYTILSYQYAGDSPDPAYENVDLQAALLFGPLVLKREDPQFTAQLLEEEKYWSGFEKLEPQRAARLDLIRLTLSQAAKKL